MDSYKKILIAQTAFLGDIILTTPLIRETRKLFPDAEIDFLTSTRTVELVKNNPHLDHVIIFEKQKRKWRNFLRLIPLLRQRKYDLAIIPHSYLTTNLLVWLAGIAQRIGFNRRISRFLLTQRVDHISNFPARKQMLNLLSPFVKKALNDETEIFFTEQEADKAAKYITGSAPIVIAAGSVWATKRWPKNYFAELSKMLNDAGYTLIFTGSEKEKQLSEAIITSAGIKAVNACGALSLTESTALISKARILISNDSAPLHLANAVNTPVYAFFGPTVKELGFYPYREGDHVFEADLSCRPCGLHGHNECPLKHHNCMKMIKPADVFSRLQKDMLD